MNIPMTAATFATIRNSKFSGSSSNGNNNNNTPPSGKKTILKIVAALIIGIGMIFSANCIQDSLHCKVSATIIKKYDMSHGYKHHYYQEFAFVLKSDNGIYFSENVDLVTFTTCNVGDRITFTECSKQKMKMMDDTEYTIRDISIFFLLLFSILTFLYIPWTIIVYFSEC